MARNESPNRLFKPIAVFAATMGYTALGLQLMETGASNLHMPTVPSLLIQGLLVPILTINSAGAVPVLFENTEKQISEEQVRGRLRRRGATRLDFYAINFGLNIITAPLVALAFQGNVGNEIAAGVAAGAIGAAATLKTGLIRSHANTWRV